MTFLVYLIFKDHRYNIASNSPPVGRNLTIKGSK